MALTREQLALADELTAKVDDYAKRAEAAARPVSLAEDLLGWAPTWSYLGAARELLSNETQQQIAGALNMVRDLIPRWRGERRQWVEAGVRSTDGKPYPLAQWLDEGNSIASTLATALGELHKVRTWTGITQTAQATEQRIADAGRAVAATVEQVGKTLADPWPWYVKAGLAVGGVVLVTGGAAVAWQAIRHTPVGLALRGAVMVANASPLASAARDAGARAREAIESRQSAATKSSKSRS
ncbi:hypothetical protein MYSTI_04162 [Myxococcus stipitatus DSM 14675]|uniref:Uncharacterized protein n=1 Tax=Myxococcus stipitatus (strain DSM 14675 / JCM 12634 / Mx s8) TaxID=1278073 RepID=L7UD08_MYXSD|nr:hypothetical protein [Myxococcus stipitatus]AGC45462.1 hypothetical protein MYSTI_04162 [Myxococcus stipitatus DSM 14675]